MAERVANLCCGHAACQREAVEAYRRGYEDRAKERDFDPGHALERFTKGGQPARWWRYAVLRGEGVPAALDGRWYDLGEMRDAEHMLPSPGLSATLDATNRWEQRSDGAVAVVYEWVRR